PNTASKLREGIERFFITDINNPGASAEAQSTLPVMIDAWGTNKKIDNVNDENVTAAVSIFNHVPGGANVLYLDGHVEFLKYQGSGGKFPVTTYGEPYHHEIQGWSSHLVEGVH